MNDKQIDELINKVLREDQTLPEGLSERLEQQIDAWAAAEKKETIRSSFRQRSLYWLSGAAAVALLCIGIFQFVGRAKRRKRSAGSRHCRPGSTRFPVCKPE